MGYKFSENEEMLMDKVEELGFEKEVCIGVVAGAIISGTVEETIEFIDGKGEITEEQLMDFVMNNMPE